MQEKIAVSSFALVALTTEAVTTSSSIPAAEPSADVADRCIGLVRGGRGMFLSAG